MDLGRKKLSKNQTNDYTVIDLPIDDVKPDPTNPNVMSDEKFKALKLGLKKHFPYPVIVDQHHVIIDGFHRWKGWKELGNKTIRCIVQDCKDDVERKIWRQVYNKVRGEHDRTKDKADFLSIYNAKRTGDFVKLLGTDKQAFLQLIGKKQLNTSSIDTDANPTEGYMESYLKGNVKQITILLTNDEFINIFPRFSKAMDELGTKNQTEGFMRLVEFYENNNGKKKTD